MNKKLSLISALLIAFLGVSTQANAAAGYYAYGLSMSQSGNVYTLNFKSTGAVDKGYIILTEKTSGAKKTIEIGAVAKGNNSATINVNDLAINSSYTWAVALDNPANTEVSQVYDDNSIVYNDGKANARIGVAIDKDPESAYFGNIYTITGKGKGLQCFNSDYSKNGSFLITGKFGLNDESSSADTKYKRPSRLTVNNGKIYIANYASQNKGIWVYNRNTANLSNILNANYEKAVDFRGTGANRVMYVLHENSLTYYNIGESDVWADATTSANNPTGSFSATLLANGDGDLIATEKGFFASQNRAGGQNTSDVPVFVVYDNNGGVVFNGNTLNQDNKTIGCQMGGMAISNDLKTFAIADATVQGNSDIEIDIYNVSWNGSTPSFSLAYSIPLSGTFAVDQMEFDYAGNLVIASQQKGLLVYAIKGDARTTVTPATASQEIAGKKDKAKYAYDLAVEEGEESYTLSFKSTGDVENASIVVINTETNEEKTIAIEGGVKAGANEVSISMNELEHEAFYNWAVVLDNPAIANTTLVHQDNSIVNDGVNMGLSIDKDTESDNFGKFYTATAVKGIQSFNQDYSRNGNMILSSDFAVIKYNCRLEVNEGKVYVASNGADKKGIWMFDPSSNLTALSNVTGYQPRNLAIAGTGDDRKIYSVLFNFDGSGSGNQFVRFDIGAASSWTSAPTTLNLALGNGKGDIIVTEKGIFIAQTRGAGNNTSDHPAFFFTNESGSILFNSSSLSNLNGSNGGAIAISDDLKTFAIVDATATNQNLLIYSVTWGANNVPSFSLAQTISLKGTTQVDQMEFDPAGNLLLASSQQGLLVYATKGDAKNTRTNAKSAQILINSIPTAIETVGTDSVEPAEYYNLQGVKVANPINGIFIKKQGSKATKIIL